MIFILFSNLLTQHWRASWSLRLPWLLLSNHARYKWNFCRRNFWMDL